MWTWQNQVKFLVFKPRLAKKISTKISFSLYMSDHEINGESVRQTIKLTRLDFPRNKVRIGEGFNNKHTISFHTFLQLNSLAFSIENKDVVNSADSTMLISMKAQKLPTWQALSSLKIPPQELRVGEPLGRPSMLHLIHPKGRGDQKSSLVSKGLQGWMEMSNIFKKVKLDMEESEGFVVIFPINLAWAEMMVMQLFQWTFLSSNVETFLALKTWWTILTIQTKITVEAWGDQSAAINVL